MGFFGSGKSKKEKVEKKLEGLYKEWQFWVDEGDNRTASYIDKEIKDTRRKAERKGWF